MHILSFLTSGQRSFSIGPFADLLLALSPYNLLFNGSSTVSAVVLTFLYHLCKIWLREDFGNSEDHERVFGIDQVGSYCSIQKDLEELCVHEQVLLDKGLPAKPGSLESVPHFLTWYSHHLIHQSTWNYTDFQKTKLTIYLVQFCFGLAEDWASLLCTAMVGCSSTRSPTPKGECDDPF